jgi:lipopolysaccharide/colanic/teichoic acid biosynthesis glycosyltransferase
MNAQECVPDEAVFTPPAAHPGYDQIKRLMDVCIAGLVLVVLSPIWLGIACAIKFTSKGPALFSRTVVGRGGLPFVYYKFRTMRHGNDDRAHRAFIESYVKENRPFAVDTDARTGKQRQVFKVVGDPRVTPIGALLRKTSLDEIPQLINVLRGEMSIVGPRPPVTFEYALYDQASKARLSVLPGLTGWAQVQGRGGVSFADMCRLDLEYIRRRSAILDLRIMLATAKVLLRGA